MAGIFRYGWRQAAEGVDVDNSDVATCATLFRPVAASHAVSGRHERPSLPVAATPIRRADFFFSHAFAG